MLPGLRGVVVVIAIESDQGGLFGEFVQAVGVGEGDEFVMLAVEQEDGDVQLRKGTVGAKGMANQQGRGEVTAGHGGHTGEGAFENQGGGLVAGGKVGGDGSAEGSTKINQTFVIDLWFGQYLLNEPMGIVADDGLTGVAVGAAEAAIFDEQNAQTQRLKSHGVQVKVGDGFAVAVQVNQ